ncbi:MAG: Hsp20/alpha crystallin family protein [Akkermansiaceae bacterium]|nr:Hsp20/alpha crystallin family protein [Akkermansiaceae bacterium]
MKNALSLWDPFRELSDLGRRFGSLMSGESFPRGTAAGVWLPAVDVEEDSNAWLITADLPEVKKEDIRVAVSDGVLTLSGERRRETEEDDKDRKFHRIERVYGSYERSFRLPDGVEPAEVSAEFHDGVLRIRMPKGKERQPEAHQIEVT